MSYPPPTHTHTHTACAALAHSTTTAVVGRNSNIELLRCVLIFMVVINHFIGHNIHAENRLVQLGELNFVSSNILMSFVECAVNCFVLISGYYTIKLSLRKLALFVLSIVFYEVVIHICYYPITRTLFFFPLQYWFVRPYIGLMLIAPLLNKGLEFMSAKNLRNLLLIAVIVFILPIVSYTGNLGRNFLMFVLLYLTGNYLHNIKLNGWKPFIGYVLCCFLIFVETYLLAMKGLWSGSKTLSFSDDNILVYFAAIFLFLSFRNLIINSNFINKIARSAFYVYIISENIHLYTKPTSIYDFLRVDRWAMSNWYPLKVIGASLCVFIVCIIIDRIRVALLGRLENKLGNWIDSKNIILCTGKSIRPKQQS